MRVEIRKIDSMRVEIRKIDNMRVEIRKIIMEIEKNKQMKWTL